MAIKFKVTEERAAVRYVCVYTCRHETHVGQSVAPATLRRLVYSIQSSDGSVTYNQFRPSSLIGTTEKQITRLNRIHREYVSLTLIQGDENSFRTAISFVLSIVNDYKVSKMYLQVNCKQ